MWIPTWRERCKVNPDHNGAAIITTSMIQQRMQEEIEDLRRVFRSALREDGSMAIRDRIAWSMFKEQCDKLGAPRSLYWRPEQIKMLRKAWAMGFSPEQTVGGYVSRA